MFHEAAVFEFLQNFFFVAEMRFAPITGMIFVHDKLFVLSKLSANAFKFSANDLMPRFFKSPADNIIDGINRNESVLVHVEDNFLKLVDFKPSDDTI